jgi:hypothetical protein
MHEHPSTKGPRYLGISLGITFSFFVIELLGGLFTNSLALVTDSWHMLNDVFALALSLIAAWIAQRPLNAKKTYGYYRAEILVAFLQGILLWAIVLFMFYEALLRIQQPVEVMSLNMLVIAFLGLAANGFSAAILSKSRDDSLNIKGAFLHVVADILGSVGAISAGVIMLFTGWYQADPLISIDRSIDFRCGFFCDFMWYIGFMSVAVIPIDEAFEEEEQDEAHCDIDEDGCVLDEFYCFRNEIEVGGTKNWSCREGYKDEQDIVQSLLLEWQREDACQREKAND